MRKIKRRHRRYNNLMWLYSVIASFCLLTMGVGYAILSAENNIQIDVTKTEAPVSVEEKITGLIGSSTSVASGIGTLEKIEQPATTQTAAQTEYRYRGANPNNYVTFNGEEWRIIGVVDGKVKIIRNASLGNKAWDSNKVNEWPSSTLKTYLNGTYYNGLSTEAKGMIENSTWYLGGWNTNAIKTNVMYQKERGNTVYSGRSTKTTGNIAIMYPSDYGYAASSSCSNSQNLSAYNNSTCTGNNWLYNSSINQWTLAPLSVHSRGAFLVYSDGSVSNGSGSVSNTNGMRPVLYLKENVQIIGGDGSQSKPYALQIN